MNLNTIKSNYNNFDDLKIKNIALKESSSLRPEVIDILKAEIIKRKLSQDLIDAIDSQTRELTEEEFKEYCEILRNHPCPNCNSKTSKLNVSMTGKVISAIIFTNYSKDLKIACSYCLDEFNKNANMKSALFGWWGIPWGPIHTIRSFIFNSSMKQNNRTQKPNELFQGFVMNNIGILENSRNSPQKLTMFLRKLNNK